MKKILKLGIIKKTAYISWRIYLSIYIFINTFRKSSNKNPCIFYGGAFTGNNGGPLVKIKKLKKYFPEHKHNFNIVYLLSNNQYLNNISLNIINKRKIPIILNQNGVFYPSWFKGNWRKENLKLSKIYHTADYVLWQSKFSKKASDKFLGKRLGFGEILYNAVDTEIFLPKEKLYKNKFTFLITGNIRASNNYRILVVIKALKNIIKKNKNIYLNIAGFIEDKIHIINIINKLNIEKNINFINEYSQINAPNIYREADAYITMTFQDNCPSAVLEAMSCGLPILYSNSGGIPELVDRDSGIGLHVKENWENIEIPRSAEIEESMLKIIDKRAEMSKAARSRAIDFFDIKDWINKHNEVIEKLMN